MTELNIMTGNEFIDRINTILGYRFEDMLDLLKLKDTKDFRKISKDKKKIIMDLYERHAGSSHIKMSSFEKNMLYDSLLTQSQKSKTKNRLRERLEERRRQRQNQANMTEIQQLLTNMEETQMEPMKIVKKGRS
jgi:hypothetical protein